MIEWDIKDPKFIMKQINALIIEGLHAGQSENIYNVFPKLKEKLLEKNQIPKQIIEIGTCRGGFTVFLKKLFPESDVYTFDITKDMPKGLHHPPYQLNDAFPVFEKFDIHFEECDIFSNIEKIKEIIQRDGLTILLCDGGNKPREFATLAQFLKIGDLIFAHDYVDTPENFQANFYGKIWNWHETQESDLKSTCEQYNLTPFMQEDFATAVWASRIKN
jgi:hypothetical protein